MGHEIRKLVEELQLDIVCVQEPYVKNGRIPGMPVTTRQILSGQHPMTATVVFNRDYAVTVIQQHTDTHCVAVEIVSVGCRLVLVNQYYQFADPIQSHIRKTRCILRDMGDRPVLIVADANAKSALWHSDRMDDRGQEIELLIAEADLEVINRPNNPPTYHGRAGAMTNIDITLVNQRLARRVEQWMVEEGQTSSDHNLIHFTITSEHREAGNTTVDRRNYNLRRANWDLLRRRFLEQPPVMEGRADDMAKDLVKKIKDAMNAAIPRMKSVNRFLKSSWADHLSGLRAAARRLRRRYQGSIAGVERERSLQEYRQAKGVRAGTLRCEDTLLGCFCG